MAKSFFVSIFILICAVIIEVSILSNLSVLLVVPDIVLMCSIYFSLLNGRSFGVTNGFISGLLLDFATGVPFGFNCVLRTILGYVYGFFAESLIVTGLIMPMFTVGIGTIIKNILTNLINVIYPNINLNFVSLISTDFLFEFIANIILAPIVFKFLNVFKKSLSIKTIQDKVDNA